LLCTGAEEIVFYDEVKLFMSIDICVKWVKKKRGDRGLALKASFDCGSKLGHL